MSNTSARSNPSNTIAKNKQKITYKDLLFHNFAGANRIIVSLKDHDQQHITIPCNTTLLDGLAIDDIVDIVCRIQSISKCNDLIKKHHPSRRLCIYHNSMLVAPIVDLLVDHNSYSSYHVFTSTIEMDSMAKLLLKKYTNNNISNVTIRFNDIESNIASMLRVIANEYDDLYDDRTGAPFDSLILVDYSNGLEELCEILKWRKLDTYISMPYSYTMILLLRYFFRYYCDLDVVSNMYGYCIVKVSRNNTRSNVPSMYIWNKIVDAYVCIHNWLRPMFQYKAKNNT